MTTAWLNSVRALSLVAPVLSSFKTISRPCVSPNFPTLLAAVWLSVPSATGCASRVLVLTGGKVSRKYGNFKVLSSLKLGWKNSRACKHRSQEMLNSCRKFVRLNICNLKIRRKSSNPYLCTLVSSKAVQN
jgi:hypothetical protein